MSDVASKANSALKPSKPLISPASPKTQGIAKNQKEFTSPAKNVSKISTSVVKLSSSKHTLTTSKPNSDKKEKRVYELPGQKHDPPEERDPLRIFYESLYRENPKSEMALIWMMEHGLLSRDAAKHALERKKKIQLNQKLGLSGKVLKGVAIKSEKLTSKAVLMRDRMESKMAVFKHEKAVATGMVVTPNKKVFTSFNGDSKILSNVKRKLDLGSDSDDDKPLKPKKKFNMGA